jgi:hypothetical protein
MKIQRVVIALIAVVLSSVTTVVAQKSTKDSDFKEVYTGTLMATNGPMRTTSFNLSIKDYTPDDVAQGYLAMLVEGDQFDLLKKIKDLNLGFMSAHGSLGRRLLIVRKHELPDGNTRIIAAFERSQSFGEVRGGYRVSDYPFAVIEITVNAKGKGVGVGTFIAACAVDMKKDKKTGKYQLQMENFGTFPNKVMGVMRR